MEIDGKVTNGESYPFQFLQDLFIDAALLEINSGALDDICDDLLVDISHLSVRHLEEGCSWIDGRIGDRVGEAKSEPTERYLSTPRRERYSIIRK
jgi:hypothetical protein